MSIYDNLNEQQKEAVFTVNGPLLILAGAGSGKTSVITHRIAYLIDKAGVNPYNILAITFTNKAAGEMRERVDKLVGFGSEQIHVSTFHSMCVRILRRFADRIDYDNSFSIYDTDDQKHVMKEVLKKLEIDSKLLKDREVLNAISHCKDELITVDEYIRDSAGDFKKQKIASCYLEYERTLKKNNAFDFDDLLMKTVELFKANPDVLENYQRRWQFIMVDEYQDTNTAQFELIRLLAGTTHNLCVVGDDDQSIYRFRGANIRNILDFEHFYPEAKVVKLEQNYRSHQNILDAANAVIRNNSSRKSKALWSERDKGPKIRFREFDDAYEESEYVSCEIKHSVREGTSEYKENAILYRTNAQSRSFEERLVRDNVPYKIVGGINFYSRREIKDLLAYLKTIDNGRDDLAVRRIINVPKRGIGATTVTKVQEAADAHGISFFDALDRPDLTGVRGTAGEKLHNFVNMILLFRARVEEKGMESILDDVLDRTDYINQMDVESEEEAEERIENIEELRSKLALFIEENDEPTLSSFLEEVALIADIDTVDGNDDRVLLMTIHSAKGLEFKNVYLVGMEDGLFPSYMSISTGDNEVEEERRLAYVAITRAKDDLTITTAKQRMNHGETQYNPVSRFVREIPRELFDIAPRTAKRRVDFDDYDDYDKKPFSFSHKPYAQESYAGFKRVKDEEPRVSSKPFIATMSTVKKGSELAGSGSLGYGVGDKVSHVKFGTGTVLKIEDGGNDKKVTVQFDTAGVRVMYASFARLVKV